MENILLLVISILALVGFILIAIGIYKNNELIDNKNIVTDFYRRKCEQEHAEKEEYKKLRLQEVHNNTVLVNKNRKLTKQLKEIETVIFSNNYGRNDITLNKIKELFIDGNQDK